MDVPRGGTPEPYSLARETVRGGEAMGETRGEREA